MNIHLDLDNTLICSYWVPDKKDWRETGGEAYLPKNLEYDEILPGYITYLRPSAKKLIEVARYLVGHNRVFILTMASFPYAQKICSKYGFDFPDHQIKSTKQISRYDTCGFVGKNILVDDLSYQLLESKVRYLLLEKHNFIKIAVFDPFRGFDPKFDDEQVDIVIRDLESRHY